jgi:transcription antitermination factor NusG
LIKCDDIDTLVPFEEKARKVHRHVKRKLTGKYPLLPRYVFACCDPIERLFQQIFPFPSIVLGVISMNGQPVPLHDKGIAWLRRLTNEPELLHKLSKTNLHRTFSEGKAVQILKGPWSQLRAKFVELNMEDRSAKILVHLFGRWQELEQPLENLDPIE